MDAKYEETKAHQEKDANGKTVSFTLDWLSDEGVYTMDAYDEEGCVSIDNDFCCRSRNEAYAVRKAKKYIRENDLCL